jgi:PKD repeat protein
MSVASEFSADVVYGTIPLTVTFTDESTGGGGETVTAWHWYFGDNAESTEQNPTHTYVDNASYDVRLEVTGDAAGTDFEEKEDYIVVRPRSDLPRGSADVPETNDDPVDIVLRWTAYALANVDTDYRIESDEAASGTFAEVATQDATVRIALGDYYPYYTMLAADIDKDDASITIDGGDTVTVLGDDFDNLDYVKIDGETIQLNQGINPLTTFPEVTRGVDDTIPRSHSAGTVVIKMHESYTDTSVTFGDRHVIRYHIVTVTPDGDLVPAEVLAVKPTMPPTSDYCRVWGVLNDTENAPLSGIAISLVPTDELYNIRTGERVRIVEQTTTTDADGYFEVLALRDVAASRTGVLQLTIDDAFVVLTEIHDESHVNYLECYTQ